MDDIKKIKNEWFGAADKAVRLFVEKNFCSDNDGTTYDDVYIDTINTGTLFCFNEHYFVNIEDIFLDLEEVKEKDVFFKYYDYSFEWAEITGKHINYSTYLKGFRFENDEHSILKKRIYEIEKQREKECEEHIEKIKKQILE